MRLVTFSQDVAPHGIGDTRLVTDDVATGLSNKGLLSASVAWPPLTPPTSPAPKKPVRPIIQPTRPVGRTGDQRIAR